MIVGLLSAGLLSPVAAQAQGSCPSAAFTDRLLHDWGSERSYDHLRQVSQLAQVLVQCPTLSPSGATLLRIAATEDGYSTVQIQTVRSRLTQGGHHLEVLELDWRWILDERPSDTPQMLEAARHRLDVGSEGAGRPLAGQEFELASRLGLLDPAICRAAISSAMSVKVTPTSRPSQDAFHWTLYCAARWRRDADLTAVLSNYEAHLLSLPSADARALAVERLFAVAVELRNASVLELARKLARAAGPQATPAAGQQVVLGEVVALLAFGRSGEAEAVAGACPTAAAAPSACHLARLAPRLWARDPAVAAEIYDGYLRPLDDARDRSAPNWRAAAVLPVIRREYVLRVIASGHTRNAAKVLEPAYQFGRPVDLSPVATVLLDCALARIDVGTGALESMSLNTLARGVRAYGPSLDPGDKRQLLNCVGEIAAATIAGTPDGAGRLVDAAAPIIDQLPAGETVDVRLMVAKALLLEQRYGRTLEPKTYLEPLLALTTLDEDQHEEVVRLAIRAGIDADDAGFEADARARLTADELRRLPETLREDRPFLSADEAVRAFASWQTEVSAAARRRDESSGAFGYLLMVSETQGQSATAIEARSAATVKRVQSALKWIDSDDFDRSFRREARLCDRVFLETFRDWSGLVDPDVNDLVNGFMPTQTIEIVSRALQPADFRLPARTIGRAVEDLERAVARAVSAGDTAAAREALRLRDQIAGRVLRRPPPLCQPITQFLYPGQGLRDLRLSLLFEEPGEALSQSDQLHNLEQWLVSDTVYRGDNVRALKQPVRTARAEAFRAERRIDLLTKALDIEGRKKATDDLRRSRLLFQRSLTYINEDQSERQVSPGALQRQLKPDEAIVIIGRGLERGDASSGDDGLTQVIVTILMTRDRVLIGKSAEYLTTTSLFSAMDALGISRPDELKPFDLALAHDLYNATVGPLLPQAPKVRTLYVVGTSSDPLQGFPLSTLVTRPPPPEAVGDQGYAQARWLIDDYQVVYLSSMSQLPERRRLTTSDTAIAFSAPDYGQAVSEATDDVRARTLGSMSGQTRLNTNASTCRLPALTQPVFAANADVVVRPGAQATEEHFKTEALKGALSRYGVIVFYMHGEKVGLSPYLADNALAMAPSPACPEDEADAALPRLEAILEDGFLTATEIAPFSLGEGWVVLAACQSAFDPNLPDAFFAAGRSMVIGSSVSVFADSTALMIDQLTARDDGAGRLEIAMRSIRAIKASGPDRAHPAFWGAWRVIAQ